uniref:Uncharacterized protein n=1 Tax=Anopheles maculatus TaxID=74869 RepID=A0A182TAU4_9DIPT
MISVVESLLNRAAIGEALFLPISTMNGWHGKRHGIFLRTYRTQAINSGAAYHLVVCRAIGYPLRDYYGKLNWTSKTNQLCTGRFSSYSRMVSLLHKSIPDGTDRTLSVPHDEHTGHTMVSFVTDLTESDHTAQPTAMETLAERCLGCAISYGGSTQPTTTMATVGSATVRGNWTWSYLEDGLTAEQQHPNLTDPQYDTLDAQNDYPQYEIDPAYQLRYSILGTVLLT